MTYMCGCLLRHLPLSHPLPPRGSRASPPPSLSPRACTRALLSRRRSAQTHPRRLHPVKHFTAAPSRQHPFSDLLSIHTRESVCACVL